MVLTPQLRQRIEMLQMTTVELAELIEQEMVANPILEEVSPCDEIDEIANNILDQYADTQEGPDSLAQSANDEPNTISPEEYADLEAIAATVSSDNGFEADAAAEIYGDDEPHTETSDSFDEIDYGREFQDYLDPGYRTQEIEYKEDGPSFEQFLTHAPSLTEHLEWQLNLSEIPKRLQSAVDAIVGNLDEDGRLGISLEEVGSLSNCSIEDAEEAKQIVLMLDPVGCGAESVRECLIAQLLADNEEGSLAIDLVKDHFEDLQPHRLQHLSKATGVDVHTLDAEIGRIRELDPYPGRRFAHDEAMYVAPEVYIEKVDDDYLIYFVDDGSPRLRISPTYHKIAEQSDTSKETKDFIKEKMRSAVDLLRNIEHRRQTIYRVVECIVRRQTEFLDHGVEHIKPMMLKDVAEDIGMHLSTISRVVNRKYAHTPQGVIELRRFFSEGMMNEDGEEVSTRILKLKIKKMIEEEDTKKPMTDDEIAGILSKEGVKLSRRTVAKYRDQMQIPGSRERKTVI